MGIWKETIKIEKPEKPVVKEPDSLIIKDYKDEMREYFEEALNYHLLPYIFEDNDDKDTFVEKMCSAFWEDVCIEADLKKIINFSNPKRTVSGQNSIHSFGDETDDEIWHYLFNGKRDFDKLQKKVKKTLGDDLWRRLKPFFLYMLPDVKDGELINYRLDTFSKYNYIYFLGLNIGRSSEREEMTIMKAFLDEAQENINDLYDWGKKEIAEDEDELKNLEKFFGALKKQLKNLLQSLNDNCGNCDKMDEITKIVTILQKYLEKKKAVNSENFDCMKHLMKKSKDEGINKSYVVFCFNLLTDWYNYIVYLLQDERDKKNEHFLDPSIMDYEGLALKKAVYDVFCIKSCLSRDLNGNFWWKTEEKRQEMLNRLDRSWKPLNQEYKSYFELYNDVVNDKIYLGKKLQLLDYWMCRFGEQLEDGEEEDPYYDRKILRAQSLSADYTENECIYGDFI